MVSTLAALCFDAQDPAVVGQFWAAVLGRELSADPTESPGARGTVLAPGAAAQFPIRFRPTTEAKTAPNRFHFDLTSASPADQQATVDRAVDHGARHIDIGQRPEEGHIVLADPEGNEFCVIEPGNNFLRDTDPIGGLAGDGSQQVGYFWAEVLGWPLVWDQDEETAIQSPQGGTKITWGGPPVAPKEGLARVRFELAVAGDTAALDAEIARLLALGAHRLPPDAVRPADVADGVVLVDPDGNEFSLRTA